MAQAPEKVSFLSLSAAAVRLGNEHGAAAATFYWDDTYPGIDDFRKVWQGIEDGDPEIQDTLPRADLSGEMADGMTPNKLYEAIGVPQAFIEMESVLAVGLLDDICDAYQQAFDMTAEHEIAKSCEEGLQRDVEITIVCNTACREDELKHLKKQLEEVIGKVDAGLDDITFKDMETEDDVTPADGY